MKNRRIKRPNSICRMDTKYVQNKPKNLQLHTVHQKIKLIADTESVVKAVIAVFETNINKYNLYINDKNFICQCFNHLLINCNLKNLLSRRC